MFWFVLAQKSAAKLVLFTYSGKKAVVVVAGYFCWRPTKVRLNFVSPITSIQCPVFSMYYLCAMIFRIALAISLIGAFVMHSGCSKYNKVLKSQDVDLKYTWAMKYFERSDFNRALPLFEELIAVTRGTQRSETIYYHYAQSYFGLRDYYLAGFYFESFVKTYPNSEKAEEAAFMAALCFYKNSPGYSLDQSDTKRAIQKFQIFLERYPNSEKRDTSNVLVENMIRKLEKKAYESAMLYHKIEQYKSAVIALNNVLREYPNSEYKEEILFRILESNYLLAVRSVEEKKYDRLKDTIKSYHTFVDSYPESSKVRQAEALYETTIRELERINL